MDCEYLYSVIDSINKLIDVTPSGQMVTKAILYKDHIFTKEEKKYIQDKFPGYTCYCSTGVHVPHTQDGLLIFLLIENQEEKDDE
jgi:hypothetical protein